MLVNYVPRVPNAADCKDEGGAWPLCIDSRNGDIYTILVGAAPYNTIHKQPSGTVTSVAALTLGTTGTDLSSTVANGSTTAVITLNVPTASAANRGALSSTDWSTFNAKQAAITFGTGVQTALGVNVGSAGAFVTFNGAGGTPSSMTGTNITGTAAGLTAGNATLAATVTTNANLSGPVVTSSGNQTTLNMEPTTNSIAADVALNNTANYFTGPTVAQGSSGTWFASGTVVCQAGIGVNNFYVKLWDGTTVIASAALTVAIGSNGVVALSGKLATPAGNIRISVRDVSATDGLIIANATGEGKDSTLTVIRIAN